MIKYEDLNENEEEKELFENISFYSADISIIKDMYCRVCGLVPKHLFYEISNYQNRNHFDICLEDNDFYNTEKNPIIRIGREAFKNHDELRDIIIKTKIDEICKEAFSGCINLESIYLPENVRTINLNVFKNCTKLKKIYYGGTKEDFAKINIIKETVKLTSSGRGGTFYRDATYYPGNDVIYDCTVYYNSEIKNDAYFYNKPIKTFKCNIYIENKGEIKVDRYNKCIGAQIGNILCGCFPGFYLYNEDGEYDEMKKYMFYTAGTNIVEVEIEKDGKTMNFKSPSNARHNAEAAYRFIRSHSIKEVSQWLAKRGRKTWIHSY